MAEALTGSALSLWDRLQADHEFPLQVMICLTERCCLACRHCYLPRERSLDGLSTKDIERLLDELAGLGTLRITLTGGEPALRADLVDIVGAAVARRFFVTLKTSAFPLAADDVGQLWEAGLVEMNVSLYHHEPSEHDGFVGHKGAWERAVGVLQQFRELGGLVRVGMVLMQWNSASILPLMDLCDRWQWPFFVDARLRPRQDGNTGPLELRAGEQALRRVLSDKRLTSGPLTLGSQRSRVCQAGVNGAYITPNGEVWACSSMPLSFGSLRQASFAEIWRASPVRRRILGLTWADSTACKDCGHIQFCERCPGDAFVEHGQIAEPSTVDCWLARTRERVSRSATDGVGQHES